MVCTTGAAGAESIVFKRGAGITALAASAESPVVTGSATDPKRHPLAIVSGTLAAGGFVVFVWHETLPAPRWTFRRRRYTASWTEADAQWVAADGAGVPLSAVATPPVPSIEAGGGIHAAADAAGNVWIVFATSPPDIQVVRLTPATGALAAAILGDTAADQDPFVVFDANNAAWVFWVTLGGGVLSQRFEPGTLTPDGPPAALPGTAMNAFARRSPAAALDQVGAIWVFWITDGGTPPEQVYVIRRDPVTQAWGAVRRLTASSGSDVHFATFVARAPNGVLWCISKRATGNSSDLFFKQIVPAV
jgi:hypothetical protein